MCSWCEHGKEMLRRGYEFKHGKFVVAHGKDKGKLAPAAMQPKQWHKDHPDHEHEHSSGQTGVRGMSAQFAHGYMHGFVDAATGQKPFKFKDGLGFNKHFNY